ncbi:MULTISPECIES: FtsX-like permease family protein [Kosmotoga]|uniref:ABC3 transporter permease protein domain-containing protein n=1 Tax=Kosmotoga olearia (strain ATCC BAA-1733 / DSM 21960 / TBF 19.5.1) TaxID=521045 RepID=C5CE54_KOSOT|nr:MULTISPECIES: FtsX-like permease family protein [Kosmotoga]ACR79162.1 protein of unknown function DUF214 [Kosmotoga olearia TBF 19.5.1]OAA23676.1 hypothetical protein DU53_02185 [Kosmotoga sp. DU53]
MLIKTLTFAVIFGSSWVILSMLRNRIILKISFKNIFRRKAEALLIIAGSLIGTALIVGSMSMNDSFQKFLYSRVEEQLGEIDEVITLRQINGTAPPFFTLNDVSDLIKRLKHSEYVDEVLPILRKEVSCGSIGTVRSLEPGAAANANLIGVDFAQLSQFGYAKGVFDTNIPEELDGDIPVVINETLAEKLNLGEGDVFEILPDPSYKLLVWLKLPKVRVYKIVEGKGIVNYSGTNLSNDTGKLFLSIENARKILGIKVPDSYNEILVSNTGDYLSGEKFSSRIEEIVRVWDKDKKFEVAKVKSEAIEAASGNNIGLVFFALSFFAIIAGILLLSNIYMMLAQERKSELGTLRALGYTRSKTSKVIVYEGFLYSLLSSIVGLPVGVGISYFILSKFVNLFTDLSTMVPTERAGQALNTFQSSFTFYVKPQTLFYGFFLGLIIPMMVVLWTGRRISRMNIVNAIRGIPEEITQRTKYLFKVFVVFSLFAGVVIVMSGYLSGSGTAFLSGTTLLLLLFPYVLNIRDKRLIESITSVAVIVLVMFSDYIPFITEESATSVPLIITKGFSILFSGILLVVYNLKTFEIVLSRLFHGTGKKAAVLKISTAFPARNRTRTGLTIAMYALVIYIITLVSILPYSQEQNLKRSKDTMFIGFDCAVFSTIGNLNLKASELSEMKQVTTAVELSRLNIIVNKQAQTESYRADLYIFDDGFITKAEFKLNDIEVIPELKKKFNSSTDLWNYLKEHPTDIVVSKSALPGLTPGDIIEIFTDSTPVFSRPPRHSEIGTKITETGKKILEARVVATLPENDINFFNGLFLYHGNLSLSDETDGSKIILMNVAGSSKEEKKSNFYTLKKLLGANIFIFYVDDMIELITTAISGIIDILRSFLYFGMIVGIVGVSILMFKALYERKRLIGMLKAIGFTKKMVFDAFMIETSFIVILGILLGFTTGTLTSIEIFNSVLSGSMEMSVPWGYMAILSIIFYVISLISTIIPSYLASKLTPAEALRYFE